MYIVFVLLNWIINFDKNRFFKIGEWNDWEDSSDCFHDTVDGHYYKSQERTCKSGICDGPTSQWIVCDPINGDWTDWSEYTECKIGSTCPEEYPNAYANGYWCCKHTFDYDTKIVISISKQVV